MSDMLPFKNRIIFSGASTLREGYHGHYTQLFTTRTCRTQCSLYLSSLLQSQISLIFSSRRTEGFQQERMVAISVFVFALGFVCVFGRTPLFFDCTCTREYRPVCGDNGQTYSNACMMKCQGVTKLKDGECPVCPIPYILAPVCGENFRTYDNKYITDCLGIKVAKQGKCPTCPIPRIYAPVCGANGRTYDNSYIPKCMEIGIKHKGPCEKED